MFPRQSRSLSSKSFTGSHVVLVVDCRYRDNVEDHGGSHGWPSTRATPPKVVPQEKVEAPGWQVFLQRAASLAKNNTTKRDLTFVRVILFKKVQSAGRLIKEKTKGRKPKEKDDNLV